MARTFSSLLLHVVFSTKHRRRWIERPLAARLYPFIGGIIRSEHGMLLDIGGVEDHVHLYVRWRPDESVSTLVRHIKSRSSKWIHEETPSLKEFAWQSGFSVFAVSRSQEAGLKRYIAHQEDHHRKRDFRAELLELLKAHQITYDEREVFE
jgi:putative transposase